MNFMECAGKPLLRAAGIETPDGRIAASAEEAAAAAKDIGPCVVKAQVAAGKRGKAGGIQLAGNADEARAHAEKILGMTIGGHKVERLLVEAQVPIKAEFYAAILNDPATKGPLILFSPEGGMDIEEIAAEHPDKLMRVPIDIRRGIDAGKVKRELPAAEGVDRDAVTGVLEKLYAAYVANDAELLEINPLVLTADGRLMALDCKFVLDDSAIKRREDLAKSGSPDRLTGLEGKAQAIGFKYIELDGDVGVLANGAGLTMTSMDAVSHYGGNPANFLEIGGEAYSLGKEALEIVLANKRVKSLLVNFCGAFARTDVMTAGIVEAWEVVKPDVPVFFTIHGTGEDEAVEMVRSRLGLEPYDIMDDAVKAAVAAAEAAQ